MDEMNGCAAALTVLGNKIAELEYQLRLAGYKADNLEVELKREKGINAALQKKLEEVNAYIERMEER